VLRYDRTAGFSSGIPGGFSLRCDGTLSVQNSAGSISDRDLHRAVLVTMEMKFARVMGTTEWMNEFRKR